MPGPAVEAAARSGGDHHGGCCGKAAGKWEKTYLDVLGICCTAEVALVERLLTPIQGVRAVTVVVPSRTVIVDHDTAAVSQFHIVKVLNKAGLEASVRAYGSSAGAGGRWPSPFTVACGALLALSLLAPLLPPLRWLAVAAACVGSQPMLLRAFAAAGKLTLDINILMLIAVAGSVALGSFTEAGAIVFLFTVAEWLETLACSKASAGMLSLMSTVPKTVVLAETGQVVGMGDVAVGTVVAVRAGDVVPVDGVVVGGHSEVDESSLTGESFPVPKQPQSEVWAGTINLDGYISVRTTALAENSTVAKMERLVEEAQNSRSRTQRLIDSCAKHYTPAVVVLAAGVVLVPALLGARDLELEHWFRLSLVLLVSACPCALVLSTPVATFCALLRAARMGLLVKGGNVLESLGEVRVAAFDKTGTITRGEFSIKDFHVVGDKVEMNQLLYWVSSIESKSSHPMAAALVEYAQSKSVQPKPENVTETCIYHGEGIYGVMDGKQIYIGNERIIARSSCRHHQHAGHQETDGLKGVSIGHVICDGDLVGKFSLSDTCRTGAAEAILQLRSMGIKSVMLTGDSAAAAKHAQEQLGGVLEELHAGLLPEDKVRLVRGLQARHGATLMVGDGMNDAPALAAADVGVSMGLSGSAAAIETSHAALMSGDILRVPKAVRLGRRARRTIAVNVASSVGAKAAVLALAVAWRPVLWVAVLADVGTCLLVVLHSMLLLRDGAARRPRCCASATACKSKQASKPCCATVKPVATTRHRHGHGHGHGHAGAGKPGTLGGDKQGKDCHGCCQKESKPPEDAVVIAIPGRAVEHRKEAFPHENAGAGGCCAAAHGAEDEVCIVISARSPCCSTARSRSGSPKDALCCHGSGGKDGGAISALVC
ncbi:Cadmium/zinc-transporting ATPase HMA2 [Zea mays]|uniref:Cadmium/zinc-transporting ATPase HMA2 n=2 Tax=Zea mays TaxID=4577 RepID=A0A1D6HW90_MAIZE|nr:Cadmium/zinc-transporting ATPase HMA2 [Zea mays]ONM52496.1 Cadmium/zinc-transporting ATPase HMA2 [Zea mays]|eukprot:XP_008650804.1 cadmium/zinc-transporting ATPase HMA2 isoform X2 [Zea mays]